MNDRVFISVIGASNGSAEECDLAEQVGRELAKHGVALICGGLTGVMEAACRGARAEGGITIGILPGTDREDANRYVDIPIVTGIGYARNSIVARSGQAAIAIGGKYGTLSEIAYALQANIPVIGLGTWTLCAGENKDESIIIASDALDAVNKAVASIDRGGKVGFN
ncbi:MAG: TIGR00725 family protein [Chloroflexota bacterium]|nr:TIGR00725 family protein [Chloroflexota bacterium]